MNRSQVGFMLAITLLVSSRALGAKPIGGMPPDQFTGAPARQD